MLFSPPALTSPCSTFLPGAAGAEQERCLFSALISLSLPTASTLNTASQESRPRLGWLSPMKHSGHKLAGCKASLGGTEWRPTQRADLSSHRTQWEQWTQPGLSLSLSVWRNFMSFSQLKGCSLPCSTTAQSPHSSPSRLGEAEDVGWKSTFLGSPQSESPGCPSYHQYTIQPGAGGPRQF